MERPPDHRDIPPAVPAGGAGQPLPATAAANLAAAIENALAVDYDAFAGQVLAYLEPEYQEHYGTRKVWADLKEQVVDRLALPELISAPHPACISLQSALFHHGLIEQIPSVLYAVTPARPRRLRTPLCTISFHRLPPELFRGFELSSGSDAKIATPEKALFDLLYLAPGRSRVFSTLPELTIPRRFQWERLKEYTELVKSSGRRAYIAERIKALRSAPAALRR
ncbi:MAG: hypothetical protein Q8N51_16415 [Gammaproteobacteria bacterium]|nr:hypothetical protein [Gammaproteobacteria bacterium]